MKLVSVMIIWHCCLLTNIKMESLKWRDEVKNGSALFGSRIMELRDVATFWNRRPFYLIGHMANSIEKSESYLQRGANGLEVDVNFGHNREAITLYHGPPCDCFYNCWEEERLVTYLTWARQASTPGHPLYKPQFVLLYFDLKINRILYSKQKTLNGIRFANDLADYFFEFNSSLPQSQLYLIFGISTLSDGKFLDSMLNRLEELNLLPTAYDRMGFDFVWNYGIINSAAQVADLWRVQLNVTNVWQGLGMNNCLSPLLTRQVKSWIHERDFGTSASYFTKIYYWTVDFRPSIRRLLSYGVDGIMTNRPERVITELAQFGDTFRMATSEDNPFAKHTLYNRIIN